ncbi:MAG: BREX-1 system phosphatase PglZ type B [Opitutaceae bacterium]|nr:BREX-1 system phosphatase PglZ type B [Opitutaceae bacterium]
MNTLAEALWNSLSAAAVSPEGVAAPVAILWTDPDAQWRPLVVELSKSFPELYTLGDFVPGKHVGPAIWLKCVVERALPDASPPAGHIPVLYLPGLSRQVLRSGSECPVLFQPLIELEYRGAMWHQRNGRDWTAEAFLTSEQGLGLDVALDARTREALLRALPLLINEPLAGLRGRRLEAEDFDRLAIGDPVRDILMWMNDPTGSVQLWAGSRWSTFCDVCQREFGLDPEQAHPREAGEALLNGGDRWDDVWRRFCEAPKGYAGVARLLREVTPKDFFVGEGRQPTVNETEEARLAKELDALAKLPHRVACARVLELEKEHGKRREWVWAQIGQSALAVALQPLARLAQAAQRALGGADLASIIRTYAEDGWQCDDAAMAALASPGSSSDMATVSRAVRSLYEPWLDRSARAFQDALLKEQAPASLVGEIATEKDVCLLFVDGLRYDIARRLAISLEARGLKSHLKARLTTVPSVTATAKPAATPVRQLIEGREAAEDFQPLFRDSNQVASAQRLRDAMAKKGVEVIEPGEVKIPVGAEAGGWSESGQFDHLGHSLQGELPRHLDLQVEALVERIESLLNGGWTAVRVITDHGWLLLPGGLPKVDLPHYLAASKWARCATLKGESASTVPEYGWFWNPHVRIAVPHGIGAFLAGNEYSHGGISPQESITPDLLVERTIAKITAKIGAISWRGLRCRVQIQGASAGLKVDLRQNWKQAQSLAAAAKEVDAEGIGSLAVRDDSLEGSAASVVLLDAAGQVIDHQPTTIGEIS